MVLRWLAPTMQRRLGEGSNPVLGGTRQTPAATSSVPHAEAARDDTRRYLTFALPDG
jgi:hypothetical protein